MAASGNRVQEPEHDPAHAAASPEVASGMRNISEFCRIHVRFSAKNKGEIAPFRALVAW